MKNASRRNPVEVRGKGQVAGSGKTWIGKQETSMNAANRKRNTQLLVRHNLWVQSVGKVSCEHKMSFLGGTCETATCLWESRQPFLSPLLFTRVSLPSYCDSLLCNLQVALLHQCIYYTCFASVPGNVSIEELHNHFQYTLLKLRPNTWMRRND